MTKETFIKLWDRDVKPQAIKCCELAKLETARDHYALEPISSMIWAVEHDIADGRIPGLGSTNHIVQTSGCLNSMDYYTNVHMNIDDMETRELKKLGKLVKTLTEVDVGS